ARSELRHGDQFRESIARRHRRRMPIARHQWSHTGRFGSAREREFGVPFVKRSGQEFLRVRPQLIAYSVAEGRAIKDCGSGQGRYDDLAPANTIKIVRVLEFEFAHVVGANCGELAREIEFDAQSFHLARPRLQTDTSCYYTQGNSRAIDG